MTINCNKFNLLFFGSDVFSIRVLKHLVSKRPCPVQVVTKQGTLLHEYSIQNHLSTHNWPLKLEDASDNNIGLVASFGYLIDANIVNLFKYGLFNVHPSLLPQYRGSTPIQAAIRDGLRETGCTIMKIPPVAKFDIGEIILQEKMTIREREYSEELRLRLADLGATMSEKLIINYEQCMQGARSQPEVGKSYARKLKPEDGLIKFKQESSLTIDRKVRAYTGFVELFTYFSNGLKIKLESVQDPKEIDKLAIDSLTELQSQSDTLPGTIYFHKLRKIICIKCNDNKWIAFNHVTPERKHQMTSVDFYNGYLSKLGNSLAVTEL